MAVKDLSFIKEIDILNFTSSAVLIIENASLNVVWVNATAEEVTGFAIEDIVGHDIAQLFVKEQKDRLAKLVSSSMADFFAYEYELELVKRSKRKLIVNIGLCALPYENGAYTIFTIHDLTSIKKAEREREEATASLYQASKLSELGELASSVAHELNNPLAVILGYTESIEFRLEEDVVTPDDIYPSLDKIKGAVDKMRDIIKSMKKVARASDFKKESVNVDEVVTDTINWLASKMSAANIAYKVEIDKAAVIDCDGNQIGQVMLNIMNNAIRALAKNDIAGEIKITSTKDDNGHVFVNFWNNGPMIAKKDQAKILNPFFTTQEVGEGTGLGLSISQKIMKNHGGSLTFTSDESGTCFILDFPSPQLQNVIENKTHNVLIVDDQNEYRSVLTTQLKKMGLKVSSAANGLEALVAVKDNPPDLILTDLRMPKMGGLEFIKTLRKDLNFTAVMVISGHPEDMTQQQAMEFKVLHLVSKPYRFADLKKLVLAALPQAAKKKDVA